MGGWAKWLAGGTLGWKEGQIKHYYELHSYKKEEFSVGM